MLWKRGRKISDGFCSKNLKKEGRCSDMGKLAGKKLLLLGERDGVPGPAMEACLKNSGAEIIFSATECFV